MGIKFKWFRHRLTFDQLPKESTASSFSSPTSSSSSPLGLFRRSKSEAVIVTSYYRRSLDEEAFENNNNGPRELPPIKARKRSQQSITATLNSAPSMPSLTETSPVEQFKRVERVRDVAPAKPKDAPPMPSLTEKSPVQLRRVQERPTAVKLKEAPAPPIPPKRKEVRPKEVIYQEPPPSYTEEDVHKHPPVDNNNNNNTNPNNYHRPLPPTPATRNPERKINLPSQETIPVNTPPTIVKENQFNEKKTETNSNDHQSKDGDRIESAVFRSMTTELAKSPNQPRPHTVPEIIVVNSRTRPNSPPPLPTSAPPLEDPKPWFEIEETVEEERASITRRNSYKKATAPAPPAAARISNPTDELPVLPATPEPRANPRNDSFPLVIKIGNTTPPPIQKQSKIRAFFGMSSPVSSPEPPKPKARRIRVPKQKSPKGSPKPMPRTISAASEDMKPMGHNKESPSTSPKEEEIKRAVSPKLKKEPSSDTPLTILTGKSPSTSSSTVEPEPPVRHTKQQKVESNQQKPKQLSFAETATVFSEDEEAAEEDEGDSWDLVAKHRANINQNASQVKAAATRPKATAKGTEKRVDFVPIDRPRTMREMRKSQSTGAGVNLKNKNNNNLGSDESDTEA